MSQIIKIFKKVVDFNQMDTNILMFDLENKVDHNGMFFPLLLSAPPLFKIHVFVFGKRIAFMICNLFMLLSVTVFF